MHTHIIRTHNTHIPSVVLPVNLVVTVWGQWYGGTLTWRFSSELVTSKVAFFSLRPAGKIYVRKLSEEGFPLP